MKLLRFSVETLYSLQARLVTDSQGDFVRCGSQDCFVVYKMVGGLVCNYVMLFLRRFGDLWAFSHDINSVYTVFVSKTCFFTCIDNN